MNRIPILIIFFSFLFILHTVNSLEAEAKSSLVTFLGKLSNNKGQLDRIWNSTSDPCLDLWKGVTCVTQTVKILNLTRFNLSGSFDATSLCDDRSLASSLSTLILDGNNIGGDISDDIAKCKHLTRLQVSGNQISGIVSGSLSILNNLKRLDISYNKFSGNLPDLSRISGLILFLAQYNKLTGNIPTFDFSNLEQFNVSYNDFSGPAPDTKGRFPDCYLGNPKLCGDQLANKCPSPISNSENKKSKNFSKTQILMYSGYSVLAIVLIIFIIYKLLKRKKTEQKAAAVNKVASIDDNIDKPIVASTDQYKTGETRSEVSFVSGDQSAMVSTSVVVLTSPDVNGLRFEDLLRAPAELLGRGMHSSLYKIMLENGMILVVKRVKNWAISSSEFKHRMQRLDQVRHPNVLSALAFYSSQQEKLLVYEYQQNGSFLRLLHGAEMGQAFDWSSRLGIAASIGEALAFMHQELSDDGIAHGNMKSSNIFLNKNMEPCISEYGLNMMENNQCSSSIVNNGFKGDIYGFGVILLELLTGRLVQNDGVEELTRWVHSVVREEWTAEVFDKSLISEGASEARMVNLLQVAIKCVNSSPETRPTIKQVAVMINTLKEEEETSLISQA
ncbi:hypothetical protein Ddye_000410 [Dipteronia dyeriana]|uniref:Protein kinase domain-containing protein n=1 Tax=Dipteronia dyeriana TaxID=168575 RepID=A0AAD9XM48_9ROSI|nr:hypothetical protein Ddye_000410 [Dipteronia dyeriana]